MSFFGKKIKLGERQKKKILTEFNIFFDIKHVGKLEWEDMEKLKTHVLSVTGWRTDSTWWQTCEQFFKEFWQVLLSFSTSKTPQQVTAHEWLEAWTSVLKEKQDHDKKAIKSKNPEKSVAPSKSGQPLKKENEKTDKQQDQNPGQDEDPLGVKEHSHDQNSGKNLEKLQEKKTNSENACKEENAKSDDVLELSPRQLLVEFPDYLPSWTRKYFEYKFKLFDRSDDGNIDLEEYEYVLWDGFGIDPSKCREAFKIISKEEEKTVDSHYFLELFLHYFFEEESKAVGNHLNGKLAD